MFYSTHHISRAGIAALVSLSLASTLATAVATAAPDGETATPPAAYISNRPLNGDFTSDASVNIKLQASALPSQPDTIQVAIDGNEPQEAYVSWDDSLGSVEFYLPENTRGGTHTLHLTSGEDFSADLKIFVEYGANSIVLVPLDGAQAKPGGSLQVCLYNFAPRKEGEALTFKIDDGAGSLPASTDGTDLDSFMGSNEDGRRVWGQVTSAGKLPGQDGYASIKLRLLDSIAPGKHKVNVLGGSFGGPQISTAGAFDVAESPAPYPEGTEVACPPAHGKGYEDSGEGDAAAQFTAKDHIDVKHGMDIADEESNPYVVLADGFSGISTVLDQPVLVTGLENTGVDWEYTDGELRLSGKPTEIKDNLPITITALGTDDKIVRKQATISFTATEADGAFFPDPQPVVIYADQEKTSEPIWGFFKPFNVKSTAMRDALEGASKTSIISHSYDEATGKVTLRTTKRPDQGEAIAVVDVTFNDGSVKTIKVPFKVSYFNLDTADGLFDLKSTLDWDNADKYGLVPVKAGSTVSTSMKFEQPSNPHAAPLSAQDVGARIIPVKKPAGLTVDPATGVITFTPAVDQSSDYVDFTYMIQYNDGSFETAVPSNRANYEGKVGTYPNFGYTTIFKMQFDVSPASEEEIAAGNSKKNLSVDAIADTAVKLGQTATSAPIAFSNPEGKKFTLADTDVQLILWDKYQNKPLNLDVYQNVRLTKDGAVRYTAPASAAPGEHTVWLKASGLGQDTEDKDSQLVSVTFTVEKPVEEPAAPVDEDKPVEEPAAPVDEDKPVEEPAAPVDEDKPADDEELSTGMILGIVGLVGMFISLLTNGALLAYLFGAIPGFSRKR